MTEVSCRALYAYNGVGGEKITTLEFEAGDIIKVVFSGDTGWWEGEKNGNRGWFPASYVKKIQEADVASNSSDEWKEVSTETGEIYYVNTRTNATSWEIPTVIETPPKKHVLPAPVEKSANASMNNAVNGKIRLQLPLSSTIDGLLHSASQPATPSSRQQEKLSPSSPQSKSLPITPKQTPSPVLTRPKRASTTSSPASPSSNGSTLRPRIRMMQHKLNELKASSLRIWECCEKNVMMKFQCDKKFVNEIRKESPSASADTCETMNGISFPDEKEAKEQTLLQPGKFSYCDYFWNDKVENHTFQSGFCILYQKMLKEKQMCKEMSDLFKAREALEIQYAKGLATIANSVFAEQEGGTLGETIKQVKAATLVESKIHLDFANKLRSEIAQSLLDQKDKEKKELKKLDANVAELRKQVHIKYQAAERSKQMLLERTKDLEFKVNSPKHTKDDIQKARRKSTKHAEDLTHTLESYNKQRQLWFEEMVTSSLVLEKHEVARINRVKALLSQYTKIMQDTNTKCSKTCDTLNEFIKKTDADKDRETWVRKNATGKVKPVDLVI